MKHPNNLVIVLAHKGTTSGTEDIGSEYHQNIQDIYDRHLPYWEHHGWPIIVICPHGGAINTKHEVVLSGQCKHTGNDGWLRLRTVFTIIVKRRFDYGTIHEYDSFCLEPNPILRPGIYANMLPSFHPERFMCYRYCGTPWTIDRDSASRMLKTMDHFPNLLEEGFHDRLIPALAKVAGVPLFSHNQKGYVNETFLESDRLELERRIKFHRACWLHGMKSDKTTDAVLSMA